MLNKFLDSLAYVPIVFLGTVFALLPFFPEPHLWTKLVMIKDGINFAPVDWFDISVHVGAGMLALAKFLRERQVRAQGGEND